MKTQLSVLNFILLLMVPAGLYAQSNGCRQGTATDSADGNSISALVTTLGNDFMVPTTFVPFFKAPKNYPGGGGARNVMYSAGLWGAGTGRDSTVIKVFEGTYHQNGENTVWPGPITGTDSTSLSLCNAWDQVFKIRRTEIDAFRAAYAMGLVRSAADLSAPIAKWPAKGNTVINSLLPYFPAITTNQAPFVDTDNDGIYNPLAGDYPDVPGDQALYTVKNTVGNVLNYGNNRTGTAGNLEIQTMYWQIAGHGVLDSTLFVKVKVINKGTDTLFKYSLAQFADMDIGYGGDDYVGTDYNRNAVYAYNGEAVDPIVPTYPSLGYGYGAHPPYCALKVLRGPAADPGDGLDNDRNGQTDEAGETILPNITMYYSNTAGIFGDPTSAGGYHFLMNGRWANGRQMTYDGRTGTTAPGAASCTPPCTPTGIVFPGTTMQGPQCPIAAAHPGETCPLWTEETAHNAPGDRRILLSMKAFTFLPNAQKELVMAYNYGFAATPALGLNRMGVALDSLQLLFDGGTVTALRPVAAAVAGGAVLYPNPSGAEMPVLKTESNTPVQVNILSLHGQLLHSGQMLSGPLPNLNLPAGVYLVQVNSGKANKVIKWVKAY